MFDSEVDTSAVKYLIVVKFSINGIAERSDVIGAIFGQTEGLLGEGLDLRELQKTSRIGRIVVKLQYNKGQRRTVGSIIVPSSLDRIETAVLAASLETVDRVGPCVARINLQKVEDVRKVKRQQIVDRATSILKSWEREVTPETGSIVEDVIKQARILTIKKYGSEGLPAGPGVDESDSLIIVEGRADVLTMLRHGFRNVIAIQGTTIPKTVLELTKTKVTTAFLDGDRGGDLILRELVQIADIDYLSRAPDGKEVEDLSGKEILKALRNKIPIEQVLKEMDLEIAPVISAKRAKVNRRTSYSGQVTSSKVSDPSDLDIEIQEIDEDEESLIEGKPLPEEIEKLVPEVGMREAILFNQSWDIIKKVPVGDLRTSILDHEGIKGAMFDGVITQRLLDLASDRKLEVLVGAKIGEIAKRPLDVTLYEFLPEYRKSLMNDE